MKYIPSIIFIVLVVGVYYMSPFRFTKEAQIEIGIKTWNRRVQEAREADSIEIFTRCKDSLRRTDSLAAIEHEGA